MNKLGVLLTALGALCFMSKATGDERPPPPIRPGTPSSVTLRAPPERDGFSFVIYGDRTGGRPQGLKILDRAVEVTNLLDPEFVMTVGDLINGYNEPEAWKRQAAAYLQVMKGLQMPWYPVAGNHDVYGGRARPEGHLDLYTDTFGPLYYSFDYRFTHFVALFTDESLGFSNPAVTQNMSEKQMQWLRDDLAATKAEQIYVFMHHPRWLYEGCNWPKVHEILAKDGRVQAVFAGHIHTIRDDGLRDGIHYFTMGATGSNQNRFAETIGIYHLTHVRVRRDGFSASHVALGSVLGSDAMLGTESNLLYKMRSGAWLRAPTVYQEIDKAVTQQVTLQIENPTDRYVLTDVAWRLPDGWSVTPRKLGLRLAPGRVSEQVFELRTPPFPGKLSRPSLKATAHFPFQSGITQPIHHTKWVPLKLRGVPPELTGPAQENGVLKLDGKSAVRLPRAVLRDARDAFTVECWVRAGTSDATHQAVISNNESSSFGLWWRYGDKRQPYAALGIQGRGYVEASAQATDWDGWHHFAATSDGKTLRLFVDGRLRSQAPTGGKVSTNDLSLLLGADPDGADRPGHHFTGCVDEVRVSNTVRYTKDFEPAKVHARDPDTLLLLHFDHDTSGVFFDDSGRGHHGSPIGRPVIQRHTRR